MRAHAGEHLRDGVVGRDVADGGEEADDGVGRRSVDLQLAHVAGPEVDLRFRLRATPARDREHALGVVEGGDLVAVSFEQQRVATGAARHLEEPVRRAIAVLLQEPVDEARFGSVRLVGVEQVVELGVPPQVRSHQTPFVAASAFFSDAATVSICAVVSKGLEGM